VVSQAEKDRVKKYYHEHREKVLAKMREKDREKTTEIHETMAAGGALPRGPAGTGRVPGGGKETAGVLREEVLERLLWCLRCLEATHFYIINGIRGPRMPGRRGSWHSTVPWVR